MNDDLIVKPASGRHAIDVMAFGIELNKPIDAAMLERIDALHSRSEGILRSLLPDREQLAGLAITFSNNQFQSLNASNSGLRFLKKDEAGKPLWATDVRQNIVSVSCHDYERWASALDFAMQVTNPIAELLLENGYAFSAIGLQYQDIFRVDTSDIYEATPKVFSAEQHWVPKNALKQRRPWHVHQGWFSVDAHNRRILNLLSVDVLLDSALKAVYRIIGQHRLLGFADDGITPVSLVISDLEPGWAALHQANKGVLLDLLTEEVSERIGLR
jgi:uncharacterized protein (TIGR04255 family)